MKQKKHSTEEIIHILRQAPGLWTPVPTSWGETVETPTDEASGNTEQLGTTLRSSRRKR